MESDTWHILWTIALLTAFVGVVYWAWSGRRRKDFGEAANLPLEEDSRGPGRTPENGESR